MKLSMNKKGLCMEPFIFFRLEFPELQLDMHPAGDFIIPRFYLLFYPL